MKRIVLITAAVVPWMIQFNPPAWGQQTITVNANWADNSTNEAGFRVDRLAETTAPRTQVCEVGPNSRSCSFPEADTARHCYVVYAFNAQGKSADSAQACTGVPGAPNNFVITVVVTPPTPVTPVTPTDPNN